MPNTLTTIFRSSPASLAVEAPHPNTGVYLTGTQLADGTWQIIHTGVSKTTSPLTITGRLVGTPAVTASIQASGNILNIQQPAPTGTSATGSSSTSINITGSSGANATAYRFYSASAQAGPYTVLVTQASASYAHTGLAAGATVWYQMQYVGGGFYDDSPVSVAFPGTAAVVAAVSFVPQTTDYGLLAMSRADAGSNVQRSFGATIDFTSNQNALTLTLLNTEAAGNAQPSSVTLLQPGQAAQTVRPTGGAAATTYPLTLGGSAPFSGRLILGTLERANEVGDILGRVVQRLTFAAGSTSSLVAPVKKSECVVFITDSIGTGTGTTTPETDGWLPKLRALDTGRDYLNNGYQSRQLHVALADSPSITVLNNELAAASTGYTTVTFALCLGTNDYNIAPATLAGLVTNWLTAARSQFPSATLLVASPIVANSVYASESNLPAIRSALLGTVSGLSNTRYVDGLSLLNDNTQLNTDNVHPTYNGHTIIANGWLQALTLAGGISATVDNSNIVYAPAGGFYQFHNTTVATENYLMAAQNYVGNAPANGPVANCSISVPFNGTQIKIGYHLEVQGSTVDVLIDGVLVGTFNQYNATTLAGYHFITPKAAAGNHTLLLRKGAGSDPSKIFWFESMVVYGGTGVPATVAAVAGWSTAAGLKQTVTNAGATTQNTGGDGTDYDNFNVYTYQLVGPGATFDFGTPPASQTNAAGAAVGRGSVVGFAPKALIGGANTLTRYKETKYAIYYDNAQYQLFPNGAGSGSPIQLGANATQHMALRVTSTIRVDILLNGAVVGGFDEPGGIVFPLVPYFTQNGLNDGKMNAASVSNTNLAPSGF